MKARHFDSTKRFIDDLYVINDGEEFRRSICEMHPTELELKVQHQRDHATFLDLDITTEEVTFI